MSEIEDILDILRSVSQSLNYVARTLDSDRISRARAEIESCIREMRPLPEAPDRRLRVLAGGSDG